MIPLKICWFWNLKRAHDKWIIGVISSAAVIVVLFRMKERIISSARSQAIFTIAFIIVIQVFIIWIFHRMLNKFRLETSLVVFQKWWRASWTLEFLTEWLLMNEFRLRISIAVFQKGCRASFLNYFEHLNFPHNDDWWMNSVRGFP